MTIQYATPISTAAAREWGNSRETHAAVAMAIHAISGASRIPEQIWEAPTQAEFDHVRMAVENYVANGVFEAEPDGRYPWGEEAITLETEQA